MMTHAKTIRPICTPPSSGVDELPQSSAEMAAQVRIKQEKEWWKFRGGRLLINKSIN